MATKNNANTKPSAQRQAFIDKQRQRLLDLRDELMEAINGVQKDAVFSSSGGSEVSGGGTHQGDAGSDAYDRDFALSLLSKEQDALHEIEDALKRIEEGVYGICAISKEEIPEPRLEAIPFARLTVQCQSELENKNANHRLGGRDNIGFSSAYNKDAEDFSVSLDDSED